MIRLAPQLVGLAPLLSIVAGCVQQQPAPPSNPAADVLQSAIAFQGGGLLDEVLLDFDFRDRHYRVLRKNGMFQYERLYTDSTGSVRDVVNNDEIYREIDGTRIQLDSVKHRSVYVDVNSIVYFALLPYPLGDEAVQSKYMGTSTVDDTEYHKVEVTFRPEGGGLDYEDRFIYWIRPDPPVIDFMSYYYHTDGGGSRFRKAFNQRRVGGILFTDYYNYTAPVDSLFTEVHTYDRLYMSDSLSLVSEVILENIQVSRPE